MIIWRKLTAFRRNAGLFTSAAFTTVAVIFTMGGAHALAKGNYAEPMLLFWPVVALTWPLRWPLLRFFHKLGRAWRYLSVCLVIAFLARPAGGWFPGDEWLMFIIVGTYFGTIFWLFSESYVLVLPRVAYDDSEDDLENDLENKEEDDAEKEAHLERSTAGPRPLMNDGAARRRP